MILSKTIKIRLHNLQKKYYASLGYDVNNKEIIVKVSDLKPTSHVVIRVKCDVCGNEKELSYSDYNKNIKKGGYYSCSNKCAKNKRLETFKEKGEGYQKIVNEKRKQTNIKKYGIDFPYKLEICKEKRRKTCIEKYGIDSPNKTNEVKEKIKKTNNERYGVDCGLQSEIIKEKTKKTCIEKYGVDAISKIPFVKEIIKKKREEHKDEINDKIKKTCNEKYGVDYPLQSEEIRNKCRKTLLLNEGVDSPFKSEKIKKRFRKTNIEKYGFEYPMRNEEIKNKLRKTLDVKRLHKYEYLNIIDSDINTLTLKCDCNKEHNFVINMSTLYNRIKLNAILCTICNGVGNSSSQISFENFIRENYTDEIIVNSRKIIEPLEIDIFLPKINVGFEFNGSYWHSIKEKNKDYHQNKIIKSLEKNIILYHIWEDDWLHNSNIKNYILNIINISEKNVIISDISFTDSINFFKNNTINENIGDKNISLRSDDGIETVFSFKNNELINYFSKIDILTGILSEIFNNYNKIIINSALIDKNLFKIFKINNYIDPELMIKENHKIYDSGKIILIKNG